MESQNGRSVVLLDRASHVEEVVKGAYRFDFVVFLCSLASSWHGGTIIGIHIFSLVGMVARLGWSFAWFGIDSALFEICC